MLKKLKHNLQFLLEIQEKKRNPIKCNCPITVQLITHTAQLLSNDTIQMKLQSGLLALKPIWTENPVTFTVIKCIMMNKIIYMELQRLHYCHIFFSFLWSPVWLEPSNPCLSVVLIKILQFSSTNDALYCQGMCMPTLKHQLHTTNEVAVGWDQLIHLPIHML